MKQTVEINKNGIIYEDNVEHLNISNYLAFDVWKKNSLNTDKYWISTLGSYGVTTFLGLSRYF